MANAHRLATDEVTEFDLRQMLLFAEKVDRNHKFGRKGAYRKAAEQIPLSFDSPTLQAAVLRGDPLLPSLLAMELNLLAQRGDWTVRRHRFADVVRDAHLAEAERRVGLRSPDNAT